jgi:DNA-binding transcriptional regulator LsrR (DeoR family)
MPKRVHDPEAEHRLLTIAAARMRSEGLTQDKIAKRLDKSQPEVSRLVAYAQEKHFLARSPSFLGHNVAEADLKEVDRRGFVPERLRKALRDRAPAGQ